MVAFFVVEIAYGVEDGAVEDGEAVFDRLVAEGLCEMGFAHSGRADDEDVARLADKVAGGQIVDAGPGDAGIEAEVEVFKAFLFAEVGGFLAPFYLALFAYHQFVLQD